ncbi:amidohydrolase family protein [Nocardia sp. AG03]|uniref:amidohydrolase family protein n=1 Tax=Nocardia sp. AG03 TaxID=3025312 RepID=UPI002418B6C7|nr:amidohydrolase family protein [Nocardia sp. AG03]
MTTTPQNKGRDRRWFLGAAAATGVGIAGIATGAQFLGSSGTSDAGPRTRIRDVRVFDGTTVTERAEVVVQGGVIVAADGPAELEIDGIGNTLLPGLIDAHTHVFEGSLAEALRHGVTTELDMFCPPRILPEQRRLAAARDDLADLRSPGTLATAPHGHPSQLLSALASSGRPDLVRAAAPFDTVAGPQDAAAFVAARVAEGADYFKIVIDDGATQGTALPALGPETVTALTRAAHDQGLRVIAHAITAREVTIALDAGVDGFGHVWADLADDATTRRLIDRVRDQGAFVISTLAYFEAIEQQRAADHAGHGTFANALRVARALHEAGVPLLAGTDATPFAPAHGSGLHRELVLLTEAGLSPTQALAAATSLPARHFGLGDRGRIAPGLRADLLLVHGDPTRDIAATQSLAEVWRRGVRQKRTS